MAKDLSPPPIDKTPAQWRAQLTPEQFQITRKAGTERPFTSPLLKDEGAGDYACVCCDARLFGKGAKFDSGTGWPSFYEPIAPQAIATREDRSIFSVRTEVLCAHCHAHLGHVFEDGPKPTGLRYCINGIALKKAPT
ncbi:MAG: peptide-methionine (R)-S-oxide reductase MsrB [Pseudomonadota bacterium]